MKQNGHRDRDAPGLESMLKVKLEALLHDLLGKHWPGDTAKMLGVNYKTVARSVDSGKLSVHLGGALMGWLLARRDGCPAPREKPVDQSKTLNKLSEGGPRRRQEGHCQEKIAAEDSQAVDVVGIATAYVAEERPRNPASSLLHHSPMGASNLECFGPKPLTPPDSPCYH